MQKSLLQSYIAGIIDKRFGYSYAVIMRYFIPECITAFVLYSLLTLVDARFIADLKSTSLYATQGMSGTILHFITKIAEGISVGTMVICGHYNGVSDFKAVARVASSALWTTCLMGIFIVGLLFVGAPFIYQCYGVNADMVAFGASFLRLRSIAIFFMFAYFAIIGFLRGIKNTKMPLLFSTIGALFFVFFDYVLIFGCYGFPEMKLRGSALASIIQYSIMCGCALVFVFVRGRGNRDVVPLMGSWDFATAREIIALSIPVILDKASLAWSSIWLSMMIAPLGLQALASFTVIKDIERFAFIPAIAFAQVITFLVSNDYKMGNWRAIKSNIKKVLLLTLLMVGLLLLIAILCGSGLISLFDKEGTFTHFASSALPLVSMFVFCDVVQIILSGALRGVGDVRTVMVVRCTAVLFYFMPISWLIVHYCPWSPFVRFIMLYAVFYLGNGIMSAFYIMKFRNKSAHLDSLIGFAVRSVHEEPLTSGKDTREEWPSLR
jgi:multidrug resistance protein, MATE family